MKDKMRSFPRLVSVPVLTLTLLCTTSVGPANLLRAQSPSPSGTYGFVLNASQLDSAGENGGRSSA